MNYFAPFIQKDEGCFLVGVETKFWDDSDMFCQVKVADAHLAELHTQEVCGLLICFDCHTNAWCKKDQGSLQKVLLLLRLDLFCSHLVLFRN